MSFNALFNYKMLFNAYLVYHLSVLWSRVAKYHKLFRMFGNDILQSHSKCRLLSNLQFWYRIRYLIIQSQNV